VKPIWGLVLWFLANPGFSYDGDLHQSFTFIAAKQFNRCVEGTSIPPLTPLQVRYIAKSSVAQADPNLFVRTFRWNYYDRSAESERTAWWLFNTRFHERFNDLLQRLEGAGKEVDVYREFGRVVSYLQMVTSPPRVVPVFTGRFWRLSFSDHFDNFRIDEATLTQAVEADCSFLAEPPEKFGDILTATATRTLQDLEAPIPGMPVSWQAFWTLAKDDDGFGEYGPAGNNFGQKTDFRCGEAQRCLLLDEDPIYDEFALQRHLDAVRATMRAMYLLQTRVLADSAPAAD
jgi:hypothetical protein